MNNGNVNNNNKNNTNGVLAVSEFQAVQPPFSPVFQITEEAVWQAYRQCLKGKAWTLSAVLFRLNERVNVRNLWIDLACGTYYPGTSVAFITEGREVFAADFRDRIVHTLLAMRITPLLEAQFVPTTWNCRKGKGVYWAIEHLRKQIRAVSENYTRDAWVMIFDLSGFFMGIDRNAAASRLCRFVSSRLEGPEKAAILHYLRLVLTHAPEKDCVRYGSPSGWESLPRRKSLFHCPGLPIGDLLSQEDGNFELDVVDHYLSREFESDRYVDDFAALSTDKAALLAAMPRLRQLLAITCGAKMNPRKFKIVHWRDGFRYLGVVFQGGKPKPSGRTVGRAYNAVHRHNARRRKDEAAALELVNTLNSYLGILKHYDTSETRRKLVGMLSEDWAPLVTHDEDFTKLIMRHPRRDRMRTCLRTSRRNFNNLKYSIKCRLSEQESRSMTTR